jgi:hypothetical protein
MKADERENNKRTVSKKKLVNAFHQWVKDTNKCGNGRVILLKSACTIYRGNPGLTEPVRITIKTVTVRFAHTL